MQALSRRGFLAAGGTGAAGLALAACGTEAEEPSTERDVELLGAAAAAEEALSKTYPFAAESTQGAGAAAVREFTRASGRRLDEIAALLEDEGGSPDEIEPNPPSDAESALEGAADDLETAIAAYREAAALLSTAELRRTALELLAEDAAELAVINGLRGEPEAPVPFVTGSDEPPLVAPEPVEEDEE